MNSTKVIGLTFLLLAIVSGIMGAGILFIMSEISDALSNPMLAPMTIILSPYLTIGWILGVLELALAVVAIISAILLFIEKD